MAHSQSFLANQKARNAIVGSENVLNTVGLQVVPLSDSEHKGEWREMGIRWN